MPNKTLYETVANSAQEEHVIIVKHLEGTEFEAVSRIEMNEETRHWDGFLIFKDPRFSPDEKDAPGLGLTYQLPGGASGAAAYVRACNYCGKLVNLFTALMNTPVATPQPKRLVWFRQARNGFDQFHAFSDNGRYAVEIRDVRGGVPHWNFYHTTELLVSPYQTELIWLSPVNFDTHEEAQAAAEANLAEWRKEHGSR